MILTLIKGDIRNIRRDIILAASIFGPVALAVAIKFALPLGTILLNEKLGFDLTAYNSLILGEALMLIPMLIGSMAGFVLLEDRDEGMLMYYSVTPLSKRGYLVYRIICPMIINFVLSFFIVYYTGLVRISFINLLLIIMLASIEALIITLFMGAFGDNRVDGLALTKALGVLFVVPIIDRAVNFKLNFLLGIIPTYWVPKALEQQQLTLTFLFIIIIGIIVHLLYAFIIYKRFERKI